MEPYVQVVNPSILGEGPHWKPNTGDLLYVDITGRAVHRFHPETGDHAKVNIDAGGDVTLVVPVEGQANQYVVSTGRDLQIMEWDGISSTPQSLTHILSVEPAFPNSRFNDGKCDSWGRLWAGTMSGDDGNLPDANLYRVQIGVADKMVTGIRISNGIAWTSDHTAMYYIDTPSNRVDVFDYDLANGNISNRRVVYDFVTQGESGSPDGMTIDEDGNLLVGCWGGYQMIHINPTTGQKLRSIPFPTANITSAAFGGPNLDTLYVTSAMSGLSQIDLADQPAAGSLFQVTNLGIRGQGVSNNYRP